MKYKYYLKRKPKSEVAKDIIKWLFVSGMVGISLTSPYFGVNAWRLFQKSYSERYAAQYMKHPAPYKQKKYPKKKFADTFTRLQRKKLIFLEKSKNEVKIFLTQEGRQIGGFLQIDSLTIKKPAKWDKKWRIVMFDITQMKLNHRNAFRLKLKDLGFIYLQKSVWLHPFDCRDEIKILKDFFGFSDKEVCLLIAESIPSEYIFKKHFDL